MAKRKEAQPRRLPSSLKHERPKGEQLQEILEQLISGLEPGSLLPSERALAERYGIARMTVRQELEQLVAKGLVYRRQGRGTFVAEPKITQAHNLTSFTEDMKARGMKPGSKILAQEVVPANELVADALHVAVGAPVVRIERVRTADGEPMAYERAYLPSARFAGLERARLTNMSLYELLERRWGVRFHDADQRITAITTTAEDAELLDIAPGQPAFLFERVTRDERGQVIEYVRSIYRGDRYDVLTRLERTRRR